MSNMHWLSTLDIISYLFYHSKLEYSIKPILLAFFRSLWCYMHRVAKQKCTAG